jgi:hypothetical protein
MPAPASPPPPTITMIYVNLSTMRTIPCSSMRFGRKGQWLACVLLLVPRASFADFAAVCQPNGLNGAVKRVVVMEANADIESRAATRPLQVRYVADGTPDGRTVVQVATYLEDPTPEVRATSLTTIRQYDSRRRMTITYW